MKRSLLGDIKASFNEALLRRMYKSSIKGVVHIGIDLLKSMEEAIDNPIEDEVDIKSDTKQLEVKDVKPCKH